jgi:hypothetical protein
MASVPTDSGRDSLGFVRAVQRVFAFLADYGFLCTRSEPTIVRYDTAGRYVEVFHGSRSYAVGIKFGFVEEPDTVSFPEIVYAFGGRYREFSGSTPQSVDAAVTKLADEVSKYPEALKGAIPFDRVQEYRRRLTDYYAGKQETHPDRR